MKKIYTIIILVLISFITGCNDESISIELDNASSQIESTNLWSLESINEASGFEIDDSLMYLINSDNHLDIIDLELGKKEKEIIIDNSDSAISPELSVFKNYVSVNYIDYILVYDVESKSVVNRIKPVGYESPNISSVELYEDTVVFWSYSSEKLHCINFITNDLVWEKGGNREEHGKISVWEFDNEYYTSSIHKKFSKIDPRNGSIIKSYDLM
ncbi:hypothetical protein [Fusibacter sp. JL216-2]|uniref:hypothetical protein n=1 Tax=Fusibacter sp. JL216-2 TaxID=3071453 RepID=UPI003D34F272